MAATLALIGIAGLYAVRDFEHRKAVHLLEGQQFQSAAPIRVSAYPYYWSLTHWYAVAETQNFFATSGMDSRTGELNPSQLEFIPKPHETAATLAAKQSYLGRAYLDWAQYPVVTETGEGQDTGVHFVVHFKDLRFDYPEYRGRISLSCSIELDNNLHIVGETFGKRAQQSPFE
jgi:hypothetical protein